MSVSSVLGALRGDALLTAWAVAGLATPLVYVSGVAICTPAPAASAPAPAAASSRRRRHAGLDFILAGGPRHLVLQALSFVSG